jgi:endonuclease YncB( thermonuclease family)
MTRGLLIAGLILTLGAYLALAAPPQASAAADRDCSDFSTQAQAQAFFKSQGGPRSDPHRLDGDHDGRACESLPCPCGSTGGGGGSGKPATKPALRLKGLVSDVVDGDTIDIRARGREIRVRLIGIDTPEVFGGSECGGPEASAAMKRIAEGKRVALATDPSQDRRDRYGRLLAYVRLIRGPSLQVSILTEGWAKVYVFERPFRKLERFRRAEQAAQAAGRGAWSLCGPGF